MTTPLSYKKKKIQSIVAHYKRVIKRKKKLTTKEDNDEVE